MTLLLRWVLNAIALQVTAGFVSGFVVDGWWAAFAAAAVLGIVNLLVKPIIVLLTLPINLLTMGLFTFVINAGMLLLVQSIVKGVSIDGWLPALSGAVILWVINLAVNATSRTSNPVVTKI